MAFEIGVRAKRVGMAFEVEVRAERVGMAFEIGVRAKRVGMAFEIGVRAKRLAASASDGAGPVSPTAAAARPEHVVGRSARSDRRPARSTTAEDEVSDPPTPIAARPGAHSSRSRRPTRLTWNRPEIGLSSSSESDA